MNVRPCSRLVKIVLLRRDNGLGPAIDPFGRRRGQVHTAMAARASIVVMPVGAMEGIAYAGEKGTPGHAGQAVHGFLLDRITFIRHVNGGALVVGEEFPLGGIGPSHTARAALREDKL